MKLKILVVSNFYPPYYIGGYEIGCRDVVEGLKNKGHEVKVLTSTYGLNKPETDESIYRWLETDLEWKAKKGFPYLMSLLKKEINNQKAFKRLLDIYKPDIIYMWNLTYISLSLAFIAQELNFKVCYFIFDNWLARWENDPMYSLWNRQSSHPMSRIYKNILLFKIKKLGLVDLLDGKLNLQNAQFGSHYLKEFALKSGKPVKESRVIYWGIKVNNYPIKKTETGLEVKRLLYVGQIVQHKGVHTLIEAFKLIFNNSKNKLVTLTIVGGSIDTQYKNYIQELVSSLGLEKNVDFIGFLNRDDLIPLYQKHDILIFPSVWDEPFGITLLEGMSSALAVVATGTGGSKEIVRDEVNALLFAKEDAESCAAQILRLINNPEMFDNIRHMGRKTVEEKFCFETTINNLEKALIEATL